MTAATTRSEISGVLVVDKPAGPTSHDVVDRVRQALEVRRAGHTGTLDPFATGVLPVCVGKGTRLARFLAEGDKVYRATVRLGFATTTDDATGQPLEAPREVALDRAAWKEACARLVGELKQVPPAYSAKRVGGQRLYELARRGLAVEPTAVAVTVHSLEVMAVTGSEAELEVRCSAGTYIRALARDLGQALGVGGHLAALRRTRSGSFGLDRALPWAELTPGALDRLLPLSEVLLDLPAVRVGGRGSDAVRHGRDLGRDLVLSGFPESPLPRVRVLDESGALLALAVPRSPGPPARPVLHPDVVLTD